MRKKDRDLLADKFNYILTDHIRAVDAQNAFGYSSPNMIYKLRHKDQTDILSQPHIELLEVRCKIPKKIFDKSVEFNKVKIDNMIQEYHQELEKKEIENIKDITTSKSFHTSKEEQIVLDRLKGVWYSYTYPSQPEIVKDGVWILKVFIDDDYSVTDEHGNRGKLKIRKQESYIEKITKETGELILIRFPNYQVPYGIFLYTIQSNEIGTHGSRPMLNFGFYARKLYEAKEAKNILGAIEKVQLKLDLEFNDRIVKNYKY